MKKINLVQSIIITPSEVDFEDTRTIHEIYQENAKSILFTVSNIENQLAGGITKYFFGDDLKKRIVLDDLVVSTSFFMFSAKRNTFLTIVQEQNILTGTEFDKYQKLIANINKYRNIFAHGIPKYTKSGCTISYFEGKKQQKVVNETFLNKIEKEINACFMQTEAIVQKIKTLNT